MMMMMVALKFQVDWICFYGGDAKAKSVFCLAYGTWLGAFVTV